MTDTNKFAALQYKDFRLLWLGLLVSNVGSQMQFVALNWHIYLLTNSPVALGLIGLFRFLPIVIFSLLAGNVADVVNRKKMQFATQILLTILSAVLTILTVTGAITPLAIYIITVLAAATLSFDMPARQAFVPSLVPKKDLGNAMSLNVIMYQTSMVVGPALAGFVIAHMNIATIYTANTISFFAVILALLSMQAKGTIEGTKSTISFSSIKEGIRFVQSKTIIWSTMLLDFFSTFFSSATSLLPIFAKDILHVGPQGLGLLYATPSLGAILAGYAIAHIGTIKKPGIVLLFAVAMYAIGTMLFGFSRIFILSLFALFLLGIGDSISKIIRNTIRQLITPDYIRGRMTGINMMFVMGGPQLGEFESGMLAAAMGAPLSVVFGGVCTLIVVGLITKYVPQLRHYETPKNAHETL